MTNSEVARSANVVSSECWLVVNNNPRILESNMIRVEIWLILPELMCSFQRLSHACISINDLIVKPRTAHYNSYNLLDLDNPTWITVVILELIHAPKL